MVLLRLLPVFLCLQPLTLAEPEQPAPPLADLGRFPALGVCQDQLAFLKARGAWLDGLRAMHPAPAYADWFKDAAGDVETRRLPWTALHQAHWWLRTDAELAAEGEEWDSCFTPERRQECARDWLAELRDLIGPDDYNSGSMPGLVGRSFWRP